MTGGGTWYTSDTHFRHALVSGLRGFPGKDEHDAAITRNWNAVVRPEDTVWHLGDVGLGRTPEILACAGRLNGTIHLVTGNHDDPWPGHRDAHRRQAIWLGAFASVQAFARRKIGGRHVLMSHFPYAGDSQDEDRFGQFRLRDEGAWLLHGHTHGTERARVGDLPFVPFGGEPQWRGKMIHVGLDAWDLRPVPEHVIAKLISGEDERLAGS